MFLFLFVFSRCRDNILVLDVFFEALNYETIEQKKAYEVAGLLGNTTHTSMNVLSSFLVLEIVNVFISQVTSVVRWACLSAQASLPSWSCLIMRTRYVRGKNIEMYSEIPLDVRVG